MSFFRSNHGSKSSMHSNIAHVSISQTNIIKDNLQTRSGSADNFDVSNDEPIDYESTKEETRAENVNKVILKNHYLQRVTQKLNLIGQ